jgi:hypothetical protein
MKHYDEKHIRTIFKLELISARGIFLVLTMQRYDVHMHFAMTNFLVPHTTINFASRKESLS